MSKFKIGDKVLVTRMAKDHENGWNNSWAPEMNKLVGEISKVTEIGDGGRGIRLEDYFYYPEFVLEKVSNAKEKEFHGYKVTYEDDNVHIGCRTFTKERIERFLKNYDEFVDSINIDGESITRDEIQEIFDGFTAAQKLQFKVGDTVILKTTVTGKDSIMVSIMDKKSGRTDRINIKAFEVLCVVDAEESDESQS